jgi:hypothetical protein
VESDLAEISHPDYPNERLIACYNPLPATEYKRDSLVEATRASIDKLVINVRDCRIIDPVKISLRAGRIVNRYKMAKHVRLFIDRGSFSYSS